MVCFLPKVAENAAWENSINPENMAVPLNTQYILWHSLLCNFESVVLIYIYIV